MHWFALYTYWKTLPITIGLVTLISLLPGVLAVLIVTGFGLFYEFGDNLPAFLRHTVFEELVDYELQGAGPIVDQLRHNRYHPELTIIIGLIAVTWIVVRTLQWRTTAYGVDYEHIWIHGGLYWKWERRLPMERVTSLELTATWLDRVLNLRSVEFTSNTPEKAIATVRLAAIPTLEAIQIQRIVLSDQGGGHPAVCRAGTGARRGPGRQYLHRAALRRWHYQFRNPAQLRRRDCRVSSFQQVVSQNLAQ